MSELRWTNATRAAGEPRHVVTVYPITGRQLFFTVPHSWCEECDLTIRAVSRVIEDLDDVELRIKPWWNHLFDALRRGGWHAPVVTIDGRVFSQGVVPDEVRLRAALTGGPGSPSHPAAPREAAAQHDGLPLMTVYTARHCPGCPAAVELAEETRRAGRARVEVINLDELPASARTKIPRAVVGTPAVLIDGRLLSLGTPGREELRQAIDEAADRRVEAAG